MPETNEPQEEKAKELKVHIPADLNYEYRNMTQVFAGSGEVVLEFGARHHSLPDHLSVYDRIVLTPENAFNLMKQLEQVLVALQQHAQQAQQTAQEQTPPSIPPGGSVN